MLVQPPHVVVRWFAIALLVAGVLVIFKYLTVGHAAELDWRVQASSCGHQGEIDPTVCPRGANCPGWPWITWCVAGRRRATEQQKQYLKSCISRVEQQREHDRAPAYTGDVAIGQALECARIIQ